MNTLLTKKTWERFVKEGVLDTARISKRILESWYRCKQYNVDPFLEKGKNILTKDEYEKKLQAIEFCLISLRLTWKAYGVPFIIKAHI